MVVEYTVKDIAKKIGLSEDEILNVYMIGSRVYGTNSYSSDYDYIVITNTNLNNREYRRGQLNIHVYTKEHFQTKLNEQKVQFIEAFLSPIKLKEDYKFYWNIDKNILVKEFIRNSDETFTGYLKARYDDKYLATKKLFHSIRVLGFAHQLIKWEEIRSFDAMNDVWEMLKEEMYYISDITKYVNLRKNLSKELENL